MDVLFFMQHQLRGMFWWLVSELNSLAVLGMISARLTWRIILGSFYLLDYLSYIEIELFVGTCHFK